MRIGFDASALVKEAAGIGQYIINVLKNVMEIDKENEFYLFTYDEIKIPFHLPSTGTLYIMAVQKRNRYVTLPIWENI